MISSFWRQSKRAETTRVQETLLNAIEEIRFYFTSSARSGCTIRQDPNYWSVCSEVPFALFNGIFRPRFKSMEVKQGLQGALEPFRRNQLPALICAGPSAWSKELEEAALNQGCEHFDTEFDLGIDLESFKIPRFLFNRVKLEEAATERLKCDWVELFFRNFRLPEFAKAYFVEMTRNSQTSELQTRYFFGCAEDQVIGTVALVRQGDVTGLYCVSINPEARKKNLGTMMMAAVYRWAQKEEASRYLVGNSNAAAYRLYTKAPTILSLGQTRLYRFPALT